MAISFAAKPMETLKNMNAQSSKHAFWVVRVLSPKIIHYTFTAKNQQIKAEKFVCLLVSKNAKQFMFGSVPFSFANKTAARDALAKFKHGTCFRIDTPEFDDKFKADFLRTSVKRALLMTRPTELKAIPIADTETLKDIADYVDLGMSLTQTLDRLKQWQSTQTLSGASRSQVLNVVGKVQTIDPQKQVVSAGRALKVAGMELMDKDGSVVELSIWGDAYDQVSSLTVRQGITIVGCSALRDGEEIKLSLWDNAHVLTGGPIAESLTNWDPSGVEAKKLTAIFSPSGPLLPVESSAVPTCAAALASAAKSTVASERVFQINRCTIDVPIRQDQILTKDGKRLYANCRLRDWSGCVEVEMVSEPMLTMYGLSNQEEVLKALADQSLTVNLSRFNARGVLKPQESGMKAFIAQVQESPLDANVSGKAMKDMLGLATVTGDIVLPAPATRVHDFSGLALETSENTYISAHRVLLLVKGTTQSKLDPVGEKSTSNLEAQSFRVSSIKTQCLLSETEVFVNLYGYCDYNTMLQYRLDKDTALVLASAVDVDADTHVKTFTVERITKVKDVDCLKQSLATEWRTVLEPAIPDDSGHYSSPQKVEYWDREAKRLKRMTSEA